VQTPGVDDSRHQFVTPGKKQGLLSLRDLTDGLNW
jgi:hypothetical protein